MEKLREILKKFQDKTIALPEKSDIEFTAREIEDNNLIIPKSAIVEIKRECYDDLREDTCNCDGNPKSNCRHEFSDNYKIVKFKVKEGD